MTSEGQTESAEELVASVFCEHRTWNGGDTCHPCNRRAVVAVQALISHGFLTIPADIPPLTSGNNPICGIHKTSLTWNAECREWTCNTNANEKSNE